MGDLITEAACDSESVTKSRITVVNEFLRRPGASFAFAALLSFWRRRSQRPREGVVETLQVAAAVGVTCALAIWIQNRPTRRELN